MIRIVCRVCDHREPIKDVERAWRLFPKPCQSCGRFLSWPNPRDHRVKLAPRVDWDALKKQWSRDEARVEFGFDPISNLPPVEVRRG